MTNFVYQIFSTISILKLCMKSTRFIKAKDDAKTMRGMSQKKEKHLSTNAQSALNGNGNTGNSNTGAL